MYPHLHSPWTFDRTCARSLEFTHMQVTTSVRTSDSAARSKVAALINSPGALANSMVLAGLPPPEALNIEPDITTTTTPAAATTAWESQPESYSTPSPPFVVAIPSWALIGGAACGTIVACAACAVCACVLMRAKKAQVVPLALPQEVRPGLPGQPEGF